MTPKSAEIFELANKMLQRCSKRNFKIMCRPPNNKHWPQLIKTPDTVRLGVSRRFSTLKICSRCSRPPLKIRSTYHTSADYTLIALPNTKSSMRKLSVCMFQRFLHVRNLPEQAPHVCFGAHTPEEDISPSRTGVTAGSEPPGRRWEANTGFPQMQQCA